MFAIVDKSKVVGSWNAFLKINCEQVGREHSLFDCCIEECGLLLRLDYSTVSKGGVGKYWGTLTRVDRAKGQSKKTIVILVLLELFADLRSRLNGLVSDRDTTNVHSIEVDISTGTRPISIGDVPGRTI